jgi:hypothetical protein
LEYSRPYHAGIKLDIVINNFIDAINSRIVAGSRSSHSEKSFKAFV